MKRAFIGLAVLAVGAFASGCIITTDDDEWCRAGGQCYVVGANCDFYNDMDCINRSQAWWCSPDGTVRLVDCARDPASGGGCYGVASYAACGHISPCRPDDHCVCGMTPDFCGSTVDMSGCIGTVSCY